MAVLLYIESPVELNTTNGFPNIIPTELLTISNLLYSTEFVIIFAYQFTGGGGVTGVI